MDFVIEFNSDAFKHGVSEADIRRAFDTCVYDGLLDEADDDETHGINIYLSVLIVRQIPLKFYIML